MTKTAKRLAVIGAGYSGEAIARVALSHGWDVVATTTRTHRAHDLEDADIPAMVYRAGKGAWPARGGRLAAAVLTFGTRDASDAALAATIGAVAAAGATRVVYLSSTSVYADAGGDWVDDDGPIDPPAEIGVRRLAAEKAAQVAADAARVRLDILRLPGIYGPERTPRDRFAKGTYRVPGDGSTHSNRIYVTDIGFAVQAVLEDESERRTWLAADDEPFTIREFADWMCETLGLEALPDTPWSEIPERSRPFFAGDRKMRAAALRERGWRPTVPDYRDGHLLAWAMEGRPVKPRS